MKAFRQPGGRDPQREERRCLGDAGGRIKRTVISQDCMPIAVLAASERAIEKDACCVRPKEDGG